jgi:transcriptional regulator EpsA
MTITLENVSPIFEDDVILTSEQRLVFIEVIEESIRVNNRSHFFNWLQRGFQYLINHEVMIFGLRGTDGVGYDYEYLTTSRYFGETQFAQVLQADYGVVSSAIQTWARTGLPVFVNNDLPAVDKSTHTLFHVDEKKLKDSELKNFVVHGFGDANSKISSVVVFGRMNSPANAVTSHLIELLMPHIHCAIVKVTSTRGSSMLASDSTGLLKKQLTKREIEVLKWLQMSKTNWEIAEIMVVSPLTIKNHVQNILRKLNVENRGQAASKASKMGLLANPE